MEKFKRKLNRVLDTESTAAAPYAPLPLVEQVRGHARIGRLRLVLGILLALCCALTVLSLLFVPAVQVYREGVYLGTVADNGQLEQAVSLVEGRVSGILGRTYILDTELTTERTFARRGELDSLGSIRAALYREVDAVVTTYALTVNGQLVGQAGNPARLQAIMDQLVYKYSALGELQTPVAESYAITYTTIPSATAAEVMSISAAADAAIDFTTVAQSSYSVELPYATEYVLDDTLYVGESTVVTAGIAGRQTVYTEISRLDDEVTGMRVTGSEITAEPVNEVVAIGAKYRPASASYGELVWPVQGIISSYFGLRSMGNHEGIDICNDLNTSIAAADGGQVTYAGEYYGYGNMIDITHDDGTVTRYAHLNEILVEEGDFVFRGQEIGLMGSTGRSTGVHLHFEVRVNGEPTDPMNYLP